MVLKIDLSKAYDRVNWTYLRVIMSKMGFSVPFITWVMSNISSISFVVLINGVASTFFRSGQGLRQGCPLAPLLFLIVVEGLSRYILTTQTSGDFQGISFGNNIILSHILSVDDIILVTDGSEQSLSTLYEVLMVFCKSSGMIINEDKSSFYFSGLEESELISTQNIFSLMLKKLRWV